MEEENEEEFIQIRLNISKKEDPRLFGFFSEIKEDLGARTNTEVARICIKKAYETWFKPEHPDKKKK